jgi:hypothetical protein
VRRLPLRGLLKGGIRGQKMRMIVEKIERIV